MDLKCVLMGPPKCGKTNLISKYMTGKFFSEEKITNDKTINYSVNLIYRSANLTMEEINDKKKWNFSVKLIDYNLNEKHVNIENELCDIDGIIMCFDITSKASFELLESFYRNYISKRWSCVPKILVGCKSDLLKENVDINLSIDGIHAVNCTASENSNVDHVFLNIFKISADKLRIEHENLRKHELEIFESDFLATDLLLDNQKFKQKQIREIPIEHIKNHEIMPRKGCNDAFIKWSEINVKALNEIENLYTKQELQKKEENRFIEKMTQTNSINENKLTPLFIYGLLFIAGILTIILTCCFEIKDKCFGLNHESIFDSFNELFIHAADFSNKFL
jgi:GTPase SAR1 family protein